MKDKNEYLKGEKLKHIVFFSGGIGSYYTTKRVIEKHGKENVILLFTDTKIEDEDLYRFMNDCEQHLGIDITYIEDGRTPWEVFKDVRWLGNSRLAQCSHMLKQKTASDWIADNYAPEECILYLGIDWTEEHRKKAPINNWHPYRVEFPMCEAPYLTKNEMIADLASVGIKIPRLYELGFSHNNCGGMCVRGGQGHFINLLNKLPERFEFMVAFEKEMQEYLGKDVTFLRKSRTIYERDSAGNILNKKVVRENLSLEQLREDYYKKEKAMDLQDLGGCGCFVS